MPWKAPSNRPLTGPVVLAIVPILTEFDVRPTSVPPVGQLLPACVPPWLPPPVCVPPPVWLPGWPPFVTRPPPEPRPLPGTGPVPRVRTPSPETWPLATAPDPALRIAAAA